MARILSVTAFLSPPVRWGPAQKISYKKKKTSYILETSYKKNHIVSCQSYWEPLNGFPQGKSLTPKRWYGLEKRTLARKTHQQIYEHKSNYVDVHHLYEPKS